MVSVKTQGSWVTIDMIGYGIGNSRVEYHPKSVKKEVKVQFEFLTLNSHGSTSQTQNFGLLDNRPPSLSRSIKLELLHIVIYEKRREVRYTILKYFAIFQKTTPGVTVGINDFQKAHFM